MKYRIYCIKDDRVGYLQPTVDINDGTAVRNFEHALCNEKSLFFSHPEDYSLFCVGSFDSDSGIIYPHDGRLLVSGTAVKNKYFGGARNE